MTAYRENALGMEDYCRLRESVGWLLFSEEQMQNALAHSAYTVLAVKDGQTVGMGRLIGDGMYHIIVDVVVCPACQGEGIGTHIMEMLIKYVEGKTPLGGRSSIHLAAEKGKEGFYEKLGFKKLPHEYCGCGMRKIIYHPEEGKI